MPPSTPVATASEAKALRLERTGDLMVDPVPSMRGRLAEYGHLLSLVPGAASTASQPLRRGLGFHA